MSTMRAITIRLLGMVAWRPGGLANTVGEVTFETNLTAEARAAARFAVQPRRHSEWCLKAFTRGTNVWEDARGLPLAKQRGSDALHRLSLLLSVDGRPPSHEGTSPAADRAQGNF